MHAAWQRILKPGSTAMSFLPVMALVAIEEHAAAQQAAAHGTPVQMLHWPQGPVWQVVLLGITYAHAVNKYTHSCCW